MRLVAVASCCVVFFLSPLRSEAYESQLTIFRRVFSRDENVWIPAVQAFGQIARAAREARGPEVSPDLVRALEIALYSPDATRRAHAAYAFGELRILPQRLIDTLRVRFQWETTSGDPGVSTALMHTIGEFEAAMANGEYCLPTISGVVP